MMKKLGLLGLTLLTALSLSACQSNSTQKSAASLTASKTTEQSTSSAPSHASTSSSAVTTTDETPDAILKRLITYTNEKSAGPTQNYYWNNGKAHLSGFETMKPADYHFAADEKGRSGIARAVLTFSEFEASKGARQGTPLDPPAWPKNSMTSIHFGLTNRTYHGFLYNRSHSIADSLLGKFSYRSQYNFTTGTRSQNVGADQNGGMRAAEELAENYWKTHENSDQTIQYQTTPLYNGSETIPRGSIVDEKSSDGKLGVEIVVINDAEGVSIDYNDGNEKTGTAEPSKAPETTQSSSSVATQDSSNNSAPATANGWTTAAQGMVFVSKSNKYYTAVVNPSNYQYVSLTKAQEMNANQGHSNAYAKN